MTIEDRQKKKKPLSGQSVRSDKKK